MSTSHDEKERGYFILLQSIIVHIGDFLLFFGETGFLLRDDFVLVQRSTFLCAPLPTTPLYLMGPLKSIIQSKLKHFCNAAAREVSDILDDSRNPCLINRKTIEGKKP